nr:RNA-dependent RNA polymerase [Drosophila-associated totivirus 4]
MLALTSRQYVNPSHSVETARMSASTRTGPSWPCMSFVKWMSSVEDFEVGPVLPREVDLSGCDCSAQGLARLVRLLDGDPLLPSTTRAAQEWQLFIDSFASGVVGETDWSEAWTEGLTRKYRPYYEGGHTPAPFGSGSVKGLLDLAWDLLPITVSAEMGATFHPFALQTRSNGWLVTFFKELSILFKHHGPLLSRHWRFYINWELCFGAPPTDEAARAAFAEEVTDWVESARPEDLPGSDRERLILMGLKMVAATVPPMTAGRRRAKEWLLWPSSWLTSGASSEAGLVGVSKTKVSSYFSHDLERLHGSLYASGDPVYRATIKRERGKHRNIVNAPWDLFLQQSFVCDGVEEHLAKYIPTSLSKRFGVTSWTEWLRMEGSAVAVPIDQSGFDHVPSGRVLHAALQYLFSLGSEGDGERRVVADVLLKRMGRGVILFGDRSWVHKRGVLSGWRVTSILDTLLNYAESLAVHAACHVPLPLPHLQCYQGDDALLYERSWSDAYAVAQKYCSVLPVNAKKFFLATDRTEYLRFVLSGGKRLGYPIRGVASTYFSQAWQSGGSFSPASLASTWSLLASRGMRRDRTVSHCVRDVGAFLRAPLAQVRDWLATPCCMGGFGCVELGCKEWTSIEQSGEVMETLDGTAWDPLTQASAPWALLPGTSRSLLVKRAREVGLPGLAAQGLARYLSAGSSLVRGGVKWRTKRLGTGWFSSGSSSTGLHRGGLGAWRRGVDYKLPPPRFDWLYASSALRTCSDEELDLVFGRSGGDAVRMVKDRMPRSIWIDWVRGRSSVPSCNFWGAASDVRAHGSRWAGFLGLFPLSKFSVGDFRRRQYDLECVARNHACEFDYLGG